MSGILDIDIYVRQATDCSTEGVSITINQESRQFVNAYMVGKYDNDSVFCIRTDEYNAKWIEQSDEFLGYSTDKFLITNNITWLE